LEKVDDTSFDATLDRHGARLRSLHLEDVILSSRHINRLREACTNIEELGIENLRSAGEHNDVQLYLKLGLMRKLEKLKLELQCTLMDTPLDHLTYFFVSDPLATSKGKRKWQW
jgi:hypothetical protein